MHLRTRLRCRLPEYGTAPGAVGGTRALVHLGHVLRTRRSARASPLRRRYRRTHARARLQLHGCGFLPSGHGRVPHHRMGGTSVRRDQHHCCRRGTLHHRYRIHVHSRPDRTSDPDAGGSGRGIEPSGCMTCSVYRLGASSPRTHYAAGRHRLFIRTSLHISHRIRTIFLL